MVLLALHLQLVELLLELIFEASWEGGQLEVWEGVVVKVVECRI